MSIQSKYWRYREGHLPNIHVLREQEINRKCTDILHRWFKENRLRNVNYSSGSEGQVTYYFDLDEGYRYTITTAGFSCITAWGMWHGGYSETNSMEYQNLRREVNGVHADSLNIMSLYQIMKNMDKEFTK